MKPLARLAPIIASAALFAACSGSQSPVGVPMPVQPSRALDNASGHALDYAVLYSFRRTAGHWPSRLTNVNGTLYGTTGSGGHRDKHCLVSDGCGTVFSITRSGNVKVLYRFVGGSDGAAPNGSLIDVNGTLYGTTSNNGNKQCDGDGCGTVFSITTGGKERILHRFAGGADGAHPNGGLINVDGILYGTTAGQGAYDGGTVFSITTVGKERVIYNFGSVPDANQPNGSLLAVNGTLYGTTFTGGTGIGCSGTGGCGTVFAITTAGQERVVYSFAGSRGNDGAYPTAGLLDLNGTLYGTTLEGGVPSSGSYSSFGTVFSVTTTGQEHVLYTFTAGNGGGEPAGRLIDINGLLYGTTSVGGTSCDWSSYGCGTVFSMTTTGKERVLYEFKGTPDGDLPGGLLLAKGRLYGTTAGGGQHGLGTVFTLKP